MIDPIGGYVLLIGANGSMGRRYRAILNHLCVPYVPLDLDEHGRPDTTLDNKHIKGTIIATPTETHPYFIRNCAKYGPILCEKPIIKSLSELNELLDYCRDENIHLTMMNQYKLLDDEFSSGHTFYDYYNTGKDGRKWDCLQIIGAARGTVEIRDESPIWKCQLNGKEINFAHMDKAYVEFTRSWLSFKKIQDPDYIKELHYKAAYYGIKV